MSKESKRIDDLEQEVQQLKWAVSLLINSDMQTLIVALMALKSGGTDEIFDEYQKLKDFHLEISQNLDLGLIVENENE